MALTPRQSYKAYLASARWAETRRKAVAAALGKCARCGSRKRIEVHHLSYARMGREAAGDLVALCRKCHKAAHGR